MDTFQYPERFIFIAKGLPIFTCLGVFGLIELRIGIFQNVAGFGQLSFLTVVALFSDFLHGLIQRGVSHWLGYAISWEGGFDPVSLLGTYFAASQQRLSRRDALLIALAPLSVFGFLGLTLLFGWPEIIRGALAYFLLINILGTGWDLYFVGWLLRMPRSILLSTEDGEKMFEHRIFAIAAISKKSRNESE